MYISVTDLKQNLGRYLTAAAKADIFITCYGKTIAKLTSSGLDEKADIKALPRQELDKVRE